MHQCSKAGPDNHRCHLLGCTCLYFNLLCLSWFSDYLYKPRIFLKICRSEENGKRTPGFLVKESYVAEKCQLFSLSLFCKKKPSLYVKAEGWLSQLVTFSTQFFLPTSEFNFNKSKSKTQMSNLLCIWRSKCTFTVTEGRASRPHFPEDRYIIKMMYNTQVSQ